MQAYHPHLRTLDVTVNPGKQRVLLAIGNGPKQRREGVTVRQRVLTAVLVHHS